LKPHAFRAAIGLGANLGEARQTLLDALDGVAELPWTHVEAVSSFYKTAPVGASGPDYVNAVALLSTALGPRELLHALQALEVAHGRERPYLHAPRTLDLDVLWYERLVRHTPELTLPHPRWRQRAFVLEPLVEALCLDTSDALEGAATWGWPLPDATLRATLAAQQGIERLV
jgi:2-amino-4-hydroxy-6-hydroxymethyldihydropteridine diphosphokinase